MKFSSPYGIIILTDERKTHILTFHPDVASCLPNFAKTVANPDIVTSSMHDTSVVICYRFLARKKKHLAIVVKIAKNSFILTAYLAKKPKGGILYP